MELRVLVVEDDPIAASAIARRLAMRRESVVVALHGAAAFAELEARPFDLVIADIGLPDVSGIDVLISARELQPLAYRAALTGDFTRDLVHRVGLLGGYFMSKPAPKNVLEDLLARAEGRRMARLSLDEYVERRAASWKLSPRQLHILHWLVRHGTREGYCTSSGIEPSTLKTQLERLRAKIGSDDTIDEIVHHLLLDLIEGRVADTQ